jgi:AraC-like DNA-binding protein
MQTESIESETGRQPVAQLTYEVLPGLQIPRQSIVANGNEWAMNSSAPPLSDREPFPATMQSVLHAVSALVNAVNCALAGESDSARRYVSTAFESLDASPAAMAPARTVSPCIAGERCRGGLAPWQIRRVSTHIEAHLSETVQCEDLAHLARLSLSHFMRAFRDSFGCPPHTYLIRRRMELAQGLMLTTDMALGNIALECGLADQSHLSRLFQKYLGQSPAAWRRARVHAASR